MRSQILITLSGFHCATNLREREKMAKIIFIFLYLEETFNVLKNKNSTIREIWLLWNLWTAPSNGRFVKDSILSNLLPIFALEVVSKCGGNLGTTSGLKRIEDENAWPEKMKNN